jgi:hypothetical protein
VKRTIVRPLYSFVDVPEASADAILASLADGTMPSGAKIFAKRAVTITSPRDDKPGAGDENGFSPEASSEEASSQPSDESIPAEENA